MILLFAAAFAQNIDDVPESAEVVPQYKTVTEIDLEGATLQASMVGPTGGIVIEPPRATFNSLIRLRVSFNDEVSESVDLVR